MQKVKTFIENPVGTTIVGALIGGVIGGAIGIGKKIMQNKKSQNNNRPALPPPPPPASLTSPQKKDMEQIKKEEEKLEEMNKAPHSPPPSSPLKEEKPQPDTSVKGQAKKILMDSEYVKKDAELVELFVDEIGPFVLHNPSAFREAIEKADRLMDLAWLVGQPHKNVKASFRTKAVYYSTHVSEALAQFLKDTCLHLKRTEVQMKELSESIKHINQKMEDLAHNVSLDVTYRLQQQSITQK